MPTPYTEWRYIYPPRPEAVVELGDLAAQSWASDADSIAQFKLNGTRNLIVVHPDRSVRFWTRKKVKDLPPKYQPANVPLTEPVEQKYAIPTPMKDAILAMAPAGHWTIFDSELLHFKTVNVKNTLYLFDVLVWESQHLIGMSYAKRYGILHSLMGDRFLPLSDATSDEARGRALGENNLYIARNVIPASWGEAWNDAQKYDFIEGLVLKRTGGVSRLESGNVSLNNSSWMCKMRKPHKNFRK